MSVSDLVLKTLLPCIKLHLSGLVAVYWFGSTSQQGSHKKSDIDLALLGGKPLDFWLLLDLKNQLTDLAKREVDLLDLQVISTIMQFQVVTTGKRIFCDNIFEAECFEDRIWWKYLRLAEIRKPMVEDLMARYRDAR